MGSVQFISPSAELERFFDFMYEGQNGFAYSATKDPETEDWQQYFFQWPVEKASLIDHCLRYASTHEVYYGPALYSEPNAEKSSFKGSRVLWVDFDGQVPKELRGVPEPSVKLQSSTSDRQHWYWKLNETVNSLEVFEGITQRLTYHLQGDFGSWNANRVLRPPYTRNHKRNQATEIIRWDDRPMSLAAFAEVPQLEFKVIGDDDIRVVPEVIRPLTRYVWDDEVLDFFRLPEIDRGTKGKGRSAALTKLAHHCVEMGMDNAETLAILLHADDRWGKFKNRGLARQKKCLVDIINHVRSKHAVDPIAEETNDLFKVYTYGEFKAMKFEVDWVVPGLIHQKGFSVITGPAGTGKSQFSIRLAEKLAKGEQFLRWKVARPLRILFVSMEMPSEELDWFYTNMKMQDSALLDENMLIMPIGSSIMLNNPMAQAQFTEVMEKFKPDGVIFDSLGVAIGEDIENVKTILQSFQYVNRVIRGHYGAFVWFIHHPRKEQANNRKPNKLADLFGSVYIANQVTLALGLWSVGDNLLELSCQKMRMAPQFSPFRLKRSSNMDFSALMEAESRDVPIFGFGSDLTDTI